jgi:DNA polymerase-3 subunit epsilon
LLKPSVAIPFNAQQVHGIDNDMVRDAPRLMDIWQDLDELLQSRPVVIYNSAFDLRLLSQAAKKQQIFPRQPAEIYCAMLIYAEFYGDWNGYRESYVWQRLGEAVKQCEIDMPPHLRLHRAAADCEATRRVMQHVATFARA